MLYKIFRTMPGFYPQDINSMPIKTASGHHQMFSGVKSFLARSSTHSITTQLRRSRGELATHTSREFSLQDKRGQIYMGVSVSAL